MLGIGIATGGGVSIALLVAIFVSNLPEAIGSSSQMRAAKRSPSTIRRLWIAVAAVCLLATLAGYAIADSVSGEFQAAINGFAAGALLVMLVDSMIPRPDARRETPPASSRRWGSLSPPGCPRCRDQTFAVSGAHVNAGN